MTEAGGRPGEPVTPDRSGLFLTLEGVEGAGKSTQAALLEACLVRRGVPCLLTREPGGTPLGERIREILASGAFAGMSAEAELFLFAAARAQHVREAIRPALEQGRLVVCDRYADATVAYQGYGRGLDLELVRAVNQWATGGLAPDLTLILDLDPEKGLGRVRRRSPEGADRIEAEIVEFFRRAREGYRALASREPKRFRVLDASLSSEDLHREIVKALEPEMARRGYPSDP